MAFLRSIAAAIQAHAVTAGSAEAPTDPLEKNILFPFSMCYIVSGDISAEAQAQRRDITVFVLEYHVARVMLPNDIATALEFYDSFPNLIINDPTLGDTCVVQLGIDNHIKWKFGKMDFAGQQTVGFQFFIPVKIRSGTA